MSSIWRKIRRLGEIDHILTLGYHRPQAPHFLPLGSNTWRMVFTTRNKDNHTVILSADMEWSGKSEFRIAEASIRPFLPNLVRTKFDRDATFAGDSTMIDGKPYLFYSGGVVIDSPPYFEGRMIRLPLSTGMKYDSGHPSGEMVMDLDKADPHAMMTPCIYSNGSRYLIWYSSTQYFQQEIVTTLEHNYHIRCAISHDGLNWCKLPKPAIDFDGKGEAGITRPWVIKTDDHYEMWYSKRGKFSKEDPTLRRYHIGYACSPDGIDWTRQDHEHRFVGESADADWDNEMQCYATILRTQDGRQYMFYCGNDYGDGGIGYAERVPEAADDETED